MNVLLDLDGTLTDPRVGIVACLRYAFDGLGEPCPSEAELLRCIGPPLHTTFEAAFGAGSSKTARAVALYRERFALKGMYENEVYPGIPDALARLDQLGAVMIVATSKLTVFAERIVEHFGLGQYIHAIYGAEPDGTRAAKTPLIAHVLKAEGIAASTACMVGDREHDMIGASANGVHAIGALWGYGSRQELLDAGASALCERPAELERALRATDLMNALKP